jgi:hypothetical protein
MKTCEVGATVILFSIRYWRVTYCMIRVLKSMYIILDCFPIQKRKDQQRGSLKYLGLFNNDLSSSDYEESNDRTISE